MQISWAALLGSDPLLLVIKQEEAGSMSILNVHVEQKNVKTHNDKETHNFNELILTLKLTSVPSISC